MTKREKVGVGRGSLRSSFSLVEDSKSPCTKLTDLASLDEIIFKYTDTREIGWRESTPSSEVCRRVGSEVWEASLA